MTMTFSTPETVNSTLEVFAAKVAQISDLGVLGQLRSTVLTHELEAWDSLVDHDNAHPPRRGVADDPAVVESRKTLREQWYKWDQKLYAIDSRCQELHTARRNQT